MSGNNDNKDNCSCPLDMGRGCQFCNCGEESSVSINEGCYKLHVTNWLENLPQMMETDVFEVRFKNTRRGYYINVNGLELKRGDVVAVESSPGHDIGVVSMTGDMVARQMKRVGFSPLNGEFKKIYRKAKPYDIEKWQEAIALEHETMIRSRQIAAEMGLNMKIGDVEYQGDKIKAIFYYIADERVDFRELIKVFADQFRIRVEMKQIGARQEAGRIGGLGACGRELCCASWMSNFASVTTNSARTQELSLNPQKLAGQCSKLKCCLVYELDTYIDARKKFPKVNQPLQAMDGEYFLVKTDILGGTMSFSTSPHAMVGVVTLSVERVKEILDANKRGKKVDRIEKEQAVKEREKSPDFVNAIGEESITRFDEERKNRSKRSRKKGGSDNGSGSNGNGNGNGDANSGGLKGNGSGNNGNVKGKGGAAERKERQNGEQSRQVDQAAGDETTNKGAGESRSRNKNRRGSAGKPKQDSDSRKDTARNESDSSKSETENKNTNQSRERKDQQAAESNSSERDKGNNAGRNPRRGSGSRNRRRQDSKGSNEGGAKRDEGDAPKREE